MKYAEALPGLLVLALRLSLVPPKLWAADWIAVLALLWIALALTRENSRAQNWSMGVACAWLAGIYAAQQAAFTFAGWT